MSRGFSVWRIGSLSRALTTVGLVLGCVCLGRGVSESRIVLDHYNVARDPEVVRAEQPRGKRVFPDWKPGKTVHEV